MGKVLASIQEDSTLLSYIKMGGRFEIAATLPQ